MQKGILYIIIATVGFSTMEVAIKATGGAFNSIQLNFLRFLIGGFILLPFAIKKLKKVQYTMTPADYAKAAVTGFICVVISMTFFLLSVKTLSASLAAIFISGNTFVGILLGRILLNEKNSRIVYGALVICFAGMVFTVINPFAPNASNVHISTIGIVYGIFTAITFSLYGVVGKIFGRGKPIGGVVMTSFAFLFGAAELGLLMILTHIPAISTAMQNAGFPVFSAIPFFSGITPATLPLLLYIAIFVTGISFLSYFLAIEQLSLTFSSLVFFIKPVLAPILAILFLSETQTYNFWIGVILIVTGSFLIFNEKRKKAAPPRTTQ